MPEIYCGNNAANIKLINGELQLGTRYECLKKGIGRGLHMPIDNDYTSNYVPIDTRKMYCGNEPDLPNGYDIMGNLPQCLQKGVGIGKKIKVGNTNYVPNIFTNRSGYIAIGIFIIMIIATFCYIYFNPPDFIIEYNDNKKIIIWYKFILLFLGISTVWGIFIFFIWFFYKRFKK